MSIPTAVVAKPIDANGELYQRRALQVLPVLVRQALAGRTIYYSEVARELAMQNARNLNYVLGSVGASLIQLGAMWGQAVPPLQALVINKATELPGEGFAEFAADPAAFRSAPLRVKRQIIDGLLSSVYSFGRWGDVLSHYGIKPTLPPDLSELLPHRVRVALGEGGESELHRAFKHFVAGRPDIVGLRDSNAAATIEFCFPSGDTVDVLFTTPNAKVAVEVKSRLSSEYDILRGLFQCVKYQALLDASAAVEQYDGDTRTLLVLQSELPAHLRSIANTLGVTVVEHAEIVVPAT